MTRRAAWLAGVAVLAAAGSAMALPSGNAPALVNTAGFQPTIATSSNSMTVDLRANRTIIDWSSFDIAAGESVTFAFDNRTWIALNRVSGGPININGQLNAILANTPSAGGPPGGNIWLYSPQGVVFGGGARVDVGGLLATSSLPDPNLFLVSGSLSHTFAGSGSGGPVTVASGAQFTAAGHISLLAPTVTTAAGSTFTGTAPRSSIVYAAADSYDVRFRLIEGGDMSLVDFVVPNAAAGTPHANPLTLAGSSQAGNIFILATGRASLAGIVINAPGLLVGQSSTLSEGQVKIGTGRQMTGADFAFNQDVQQVPGAPPGSVVMGTARADSYITIVLAGETAIGDLTADSLHAGATIGISARNVTIGSGGLTVVSTGNGVAGENDIFVDASGAVTIPTATGPEDVVVYRGPQQTGRGTSRANITVGTLTGERVGLFGDTAVAGTLTGSRIVEGVNTTRLTVGAMTAPAIAMTAGDLELTGAVTGADVTFRLTGAEAILGGTGAGRLSDAEFQRITASSSVSIYGGSQGPPVVGRDLLVDDLTVDPGRAPRLALYAGVGNAVRIRGALTVSETGGALQIGASEADSPWTPRAIVVTGAIGSAEGDAVAGFTDVHAFETVELHALDDILLGSERFIELIEDVPAAQIDVGLGLPLGVAPVEDEVGRLFLVAGSLVATAGDRIVQQNTGTPGAQAGFYLTGEGVDPADPLLTIGGAQIADMFGALQIGDGIVTSGTQATFSSRIARIEGDTSQGAIRINGCLLGIGCSLSTPASQFRIQQFRPAAPRAAVDPPILTPPPPIDADERESEAVITGTGNEEIWRRDR